MTDEYLAGNARLRQRRARLLCPTQLDRLAGLPAEPLLAELAGTGYAPAVERARAAGGTPEQVLDAALTDRLRESLTALAGTYPGTAGDVTGLLLQRWDLRDLLGMLRRMAVGRPPAQVAAGVVGVGRLDAGLAAEVAADCGRDLPAALDRLAAAGLPGPESCWSLRAIGRDYELHQDLAALDRALTAAAVTGWRQVLARGGGAAGAVAGLVTAEQDAANLLTALRLRGGGQVDPAVRAELAADPRTADRHLLPCGSLPLAALGEVAAGRLDPARVAPAGWVPAVERWQRTGDRAVLADELADVVRRTVLAGWFNDPWGAGVPVAYVTGVEAEYRRLRSALRPAAALPARTEAVDSVEAA